MKRSFAASCISLTAMSLGLTMIICFQPDPYKSLHYEGINFVTLGGALMFPLSVLQAAIMVASSIAVYVGPILVVSGFRFDEPIFNGIVRIRDKPLSVAE